MAEIICPKCGARGIENCSTQRGNDHAARIRAEIAQVRPNDQSSAQEGE